MNGTVERNPNKIGIFFTVLSLLIAVAGLLLLTFDSRSGIAPILLFVGILGVLFSYLLTRIFFWAFYPSKLKEPKPQRIKENNSLDYLRHSPSVGGWLGFVAFGLFITIIFGVASIAKTVPLLEKFGQAGAALQTLVVAEIFLAVVLQVIGPAYLLRKMFTFDEVFPRRYIQWMIILVLFVWGDVLATYLAIQPLYDSGQLKLFDPDTIRDTGRTTMAALIWIPYMLYSKRVRYTYQTGPL